MVSAFRLAHFYQCPTKIRAVVLILALSTCSAFGDDQTLEAEARSVVEQYVVALANGDTATIKALLGGELLRSRGSLLDNPDYGAELLRFHQERSLSITGARIVGPGRVEVDLVLEQSTESNYSFQLLVAANEGDSGGPRIVSEY